jgi:hypothetical protein
MADRLYACHNQPRPTAGAPLQVQDGYHTGLFAYENGSSDRIARMVTVTHVMSTECRYDGSARDPGCAGCQHAAHLRQGAAPC